MVHTNTRTSHCAAHVQTCQGVRFTRILSGEGSIARLQAKGLDHLPSVFYSGCQNGEEETEQDTCIRNGRGFK